MQSYDAALRAIVALAVYFFLTTDLARSAADPLTQRQQELNQLLLQQRLDQLQREQQINQLPQQLNQIPKP